MPYRPNFPIPDVIDPPRTCLCIEIPDTPQWKQVIAGLIAELTYWYNYERDGTTQGAECAAVWKEIYNGIDWSNMSCCCGEFTIIFQWTEDGELEQSTDGGVTFTPAPEQDPRNSSPVFPPVPGEPSTDKNCDSAAGMSLLIKEGIGDQLSEDMGRYTLAQLIEDWVKTVIQTSNPFLALINIVANQIFALLISAVIAALTEEVYQQLTCIFYCNMAEDVSFDEGRWATVRSNILSQITGIAGVFLEHLVFLLGKVGLTNLARSQVGATGDCSDCSCSDSCGATWEVMGASHGTIISSDTTSITVEASNAGANYYVLIHTVPDTDCCVIVSSELVSGDAPTLTGWTDCGNTPSEGAPQHTGIFGYNSYCVNYFQQQGATPFTVKITFAPCAP